MKTLALAIGAVSVGLVPVWAQQAGDIVDPAVGKRLEELVGMALAQNGELRAGRQQVAAAQGNITQARLRANPMVEINTFTELGGSQNTFMAGGSLPLELYHRRDRRVEVASSSVKVAEFEQAERERQLRASVAAKFGEVLAAARNLRVTQELLELNRSALSLLASRAEQGAAAPLDANLLRVEVNRIDSMRVDSESKAETSLLELKSLVGLKPEDELRLKGSLEDPPVPPGVDLQKLVAARPDVLAAAAAEDAAKARLRQAQTEARADASVFANYQRMDSSFDLNGLSASGQIRPIQGVFHFLNAGVSITLPVRNRNQGAIETATAQIDEAKRRREYAELIAEREFQAGKRALDRANESLAIYEKGVRQQARENLDVIRRTYELGRTQLLDVIAEQRRFIDVEAGYTEALSRRYQSAVRLMAAAGASE